jgi:FMN reductase
MPRIVGISGNITRPSRTRFLIERVLARIEARGLGMTQCFDIIDAGPTLGTTVSRADAASELDRIWRAIESCDALVVGSPVYKGSYSGLFKHLFDLLDKEAIRGRPVVLTATGRLADYSLVIAHQFRPLFGFFGALALPESLYACDTDFRTPTDLTEAFAVRIEGVVDQLQSALRPT